jgi:hypothetical protein
LRASCSCLFSNITIITKEVQLLPACLSAKEVQDLFKKGPFYEGPFYEGPF